MLLEYQVFEKKLNDSLKGRAKHRLFGGDFSKKQERTLISPIYFFKLKSILILAAHSQTRLIIVRENWPTNFKQN